MKRKRSNVYFVKHCQKSDIQSEIDEILAEVSVVIVVIGPDWLNQTDEDGTPRFCNPDDSIRLEVTTALQNGIPTIPVLVGGASFPKASQLPCEMSHLTDYKALSLTEESRASNLKKLSAEVHLHFANAFPLYRLRRWVGVFLALVAVYLWLCPLFRLTANSPQDGQFIGGATPPSSISEEMMRAGWFQSGIQLGVVGYMLLTLIVAYGLASAYRYPLVNRGAAILLFCLSLLLVAVGSGPVPILDIERSPAWGLFGLLVCSATMVYDAFALNRGTARS